MTPPHLCPDPSALDAPAGTMALRAHPTITIDLTPEQAFQSDTGILHASLSASRLSPYNTGSPQGPFSQRSQKIARRRATPSFILLPFRHKRRGHFYIQTNPSQTRSPQDTPRRILPISLPLLFQCQHHQHRQPLQVTIPRKTKILTPRRRSSC